MGFELLEQLEAFAIAIVKRNVSLIAHEFGIGALSKHDDRDVGLLCAGTIRAEPGLAAPSFDLRLEPFVDRCRSVKISEAIVGALPTQRPATCLHRYVIGAFAGDQDTR